jgi:hypothetical protein
MEKIDWLIYLAIRRKWQRPPDNDPKVYARVSVFSSVFVFSSESLDELEKCWTQR